MRIGPFVITLRRKAAQQDLITHWPSSGGTGWFASIREGFSGAWQRGVVTPVEDALSHPTFWACVTLIAGDVAKCRPKLVSEDDDGISTEVENPAYSPVIRRPNHYQNRIQFYMYWILSKLCRGNAYALKERDARGVVTALYLLDPSRVRPMISPSGDVFYSVGQDVLSGVDEASVVVPAREIIHDVMYAPYHPLCGLGPIYAGGMAAMQALQLVNNSTRMAKHGFNLGGLLLAPGKISAETAAKLEQYWNENYAGAQNAGKVAVLGDDLKFDKPALMTAVDAEVIDLLKWDDEKMCAVCHVPSYMVGVGPLPSYNNVEALGQQYYGQCLQLLFESLELCLTEGLELKEPLAIEFDVAALDRMDSVQRMDVATKGVIGGILKPNEGRARFNLKPVTGGDTVFLQRQNWPIDLLGSDVTAMAPVAPSVPPALPAADDDEPMPAKDVGVLLKAMTARKAQEAGIRAA
jgi:HK97 family phage portal protein